MGKLAPVAEALKARQVQSAPVEPAKPQEPLAVSVDADYGPLLGVLEAISARLEPTPPPPPVDLKPHVQALIKGLKRTPSKPVDITPLVKALEGIKFPDIPEMVWPEQTPYTFDIKRDADGYMRQVIATPGTPKKAPAEPLDVE